MQRRLREALLLALAYHPSLDGRPGMHQGLSSEASAKCKRELTDCQSKRYLVCWVARHLLEVSGFSALVSFILVSWKVWYYLLPDTYRTGYLRIIPYLGLEHHVTASAPDSVAEGFVVWSFESGLSYGARQGSAVPWLESLDVMLCWWSGRLRSMFPD